MGESDRTDDERRAVALTNSNPDSAPHHGSGHDIGRITLARQAPIRLGPLCIEPALRRVAHDNGREEIVQPRVMQVLVALIRADGRILSRDDLQMSCWHGVVVGEDAINRVIGRLRRLTDGIGGGELKLETITKVGYRLVPTNPHAEIGPSARPLNVQRVAPATTTVEPLQDEPTPFERTHGVPPAPADPALPVMDQRARWAWVAAGLGVLAVAAGAGWFFLVRPAATPAEPALRVAVLPFDAVGLGQSARVFADTLLDKIIGALSAEQVVTISRADSAALRGPDAGARIAKLGVGLILDGVVESDGTSLKVQIHLEDPREHVTLWSKAFDGPLQDQQGLQTRIAARATDTTRWAVSPRLNKVRKDPSIVAAYLEANDEFTYEGGGRAVEIARDVVARAPGFAAGHDLLAATLIGATSPAGDSPDSGQTEAVADAVREANTALRLDPSDGVAHANLALAMPLSAWREREQTILKGLAVDPNNPDLAASYAWFVLFNVGRDREAVEWQRRGIRSQPFLAASRESLAVELMCAGRGDEAAATIADASRLWPDYWEIPATAFIIALGNHQYDRALALLDDPAVHKVMGSPPMGSPSAIDVWRATVRALASADPARMRAAARAVAAAADAGTIGHNKAYQLLAPLGDVDGAFREANQTFTPNNLSRAAGLLFGNTGGVGPLFGPGTAAMRRDARFMPLAAQLGLVDYWRSTGHWPDFCAEPGLPYDCKTEAAKLPAPKQTS